MNKSAEAPSKGGFVFGESTEEGPNKVLGVKPVQAFLVQYTDGGSKKCVRLVFQVEGGDAIILQERIQGSHVATTATGWFNTALQATLKKFGLVKLPEGEGKEGVEAL